MKINDIPDSVLAAMVREGCYTRNTELTEDMHVILLAIPYDSSDEVYSLPEALEAFKDFASDYDWQERNFQVLKVVDGKPVTFETAYENVAEVEA